MLDLKRIRQNPEELKKMLEARNLHLSLDTLLAQDDQRRRLLAEAEEKKASRNEIGKKIGMAKKRNPSGNDAAVLADEMRRLGNEITLLDEQIAALSGSVDAILCSLPNFLHPSVLNNTENEVLSLSGTPRSFLWEPKRNDELGGDLQLSASIVADGKQAVVYHGAGALMERSLLACLLNSLSAEGFDELSIPFAPCADSPLSAACSVLFAPDVIWDSHALPKRTCAAIPLAITTTKEEKQLARGLVLGEICSAEHSDPALEQIASVFVMLFASLNLCSRTVLLSPALTEAESAKTLQIEVWLPSAAAYVPVMRCADCADYLPRRSGIRLRESAGEKPKHAHTVLSVLMLEKLIDALWENGQNDDGSITVPDMLASLMGKDRIG